MSVQLPAGYKPDPVKVAAAIASTEAELAALHAEHDEKAAEADDLWRQVLAVEQRLQVYRDVKAATAAPAVREHDPKTCRNGDHYGQCSGATPWPAAAPVVRESDQT